MLAVLALAAPPALLTAVAPAGGASAPAKVWSHTYGGWNRSSSPTIADVNGDGRNDIVNGHQDGWVRVLDAATGHNLPGWPQPAAVRPGVATAIDGSPAVADLDRDGAMEIVVPAASTWRANQPGGVVVFRRNGAVKCRFETRDYGNVWTNQPGPDGYGDGVFSSPAIGDVDGDTYPDIVFGGWDLHVHALDRNCNELPGFPYNVEDSTWGSPALYDVDDDGRLEIFIGSDQTAGGAIDWSGGEFRAIDYAGGPRELWKRRTDDVLHSSAAIGDVNGDGRLEVVVGGGNVYNRGDGRKVHAWHLDDGSTVPGWPVATAGVVHSSPALGDLDANGVTDVVVGSGDGIVRALRGNGSVLWQRHLRFNGSPGGPVTASPIVADMNGDGTLDVGVGNNWGFFVLDGRTGNEVAALNTWMAYEAAGAVGSFGTLGWRLVTIGFDTPNNLTRVEAFQLASPGKAAPWPMFRKGATHVAAPKSGGDPLPPGFCRRSVNPVAKPSSASAPRGYWLLGADGALYAFGGAPYYGGANGRLAGGETAVGIQSSPSGAGYYVLTSRGRILTFGDARSRGSMDGVPLNAPIIVLAPTPSGKGYWLLGRDGGVFSFGDARFYGSTGGMRLNAPIISMAPTGTGRGYWLLAADGGVFSFGDARFYGSTGGMRLAAPVISMSTSKHGGYWLVALDGGVFSFGVPFYGSVPGTGLCSPPMGVQLRATLTGKGYYLLASDGGIFAFGDAKFHGSQPGLHTAHRAVDMAVRP
jgi:hypothetical protein